MKKLGGLKLMVVFLLSLAVLSCSTSSKTKGAVIGTVIGGTTGAILSEDNKAVSIIIGAAVGGVAGGLIGSYMDDQAEDLAEDLDEVATVTRVGEGIVVNFDSGLLFDYDSHQLRTTTQANLNKLQSSLDEYEKTRVNILGHTDSTGSSDYNQELSEKRALAVKKYLVSQGIDRNRLVTIGYGETDPVATNETDRGRQQNRRVEIVIVADDELKQDARDGKLNS